VADAGAVGCNFEDTDHTGGGIVDVARQADRIAELRAASPDLVINARVDVFLYARDQASVVDEAVDGRRRTGGGRGLRLPDHGEVTETLKTLVDAVGPVSVNLLPTGPTMDELAGVGIARISLATGLWRLTQRFTRHTLRALAAGISPYED